MKAAGITIFLCTFVIVALALRLLAWHVLDLNFGGRVEEFPTEWRIIIMVFLAGLAALAATSLYYGIRKARNARSD